MVGEMIGYINAIGNGKDHIPISNNLADSF